jgi:hypothetical protein
MNFLPLYSPEFHQRSSPIKSQAGSAKIFLVLSTCKPCFNGPFHHLHFLFSWKKLSVRPGWMVPNLLLIGGLMMEPIAFHYGSSRFGGRLRGLMEYSQCGSRA